MPNVRVAAAQMRLRPGDVSGNLERCLRAMSVAADRGAQLVVLPECALSGYVLDRASAERAAVDLESPELDRMERTAARARLHVVVGFLECSGGHLYNSAALLTPGGRAGRYRKCHIPFVGVDRFVDVDPEARPMVADTRVGRIGLQICYDIRFPEHTRALALGGAQLIAQPTNWPAAARVVADHFPIVRATENRVFLVVANRGDSEKGVQFVGKSQIVAPSGSILALAARGEAILIADVDLRDARDKRVVVQRGSYEIDLWGDRRPEIYGPLSAG